MVATPAKCMEKPGQVTARSGIPQRLGPLECVQNAFSSAPSLFGAQKPVPTSGSPDKGFRGLRLNMENDVRIEGKNRSLSCERCEEHAGNSQKTPTSKRHLLTHLFAKLNLLVQFDMAVRVLLVVVCQLL